MKHHWIWQWMPALMLIVFSSGLQAGSILTLEERVKAQTAIERVYHAHRLWPPDNPTPKPPFEAVVDLAGIQARVEDSLRRSAALESHWGRPLTGAQLQAELNRMAGGTQDAATLSELLAALDNDPFLAAECLARPALADRLLQNWYATDARVHGAQQAAIVAEVAGASGPEFWRDLSGELGLTEYRRGEEFLPGSHDEKELNRRRLNPEEWDRLLQTLASRFGLSHPPSPDLLTPEYGARFVPDALPLGIPCPLQEEVDRFFIVWVLEAGPNRLTVASMNWPKHEIREWLTERNDPWQSLPCPSYAYQLPEPRADCTSDAWQPTATSLPAVAYGSTAVWTGTEMLVWGGSIAGSGYTNLGYRYDPSTDVWTAMTTANAPAARWAHTAVWTGTEMIIWGGSGDAGFLNNGARYDPNAGEWTPTGTGGAPAARYFHNAVWTGSLMVVWGGAGSGNPFNTGGRYDPSTDLWTPTSLSGAPSARWFSTALWTGAVMIVWGGSPYLNTGGRYNPSTNVWTSTSTTGAPIGRENHSAVWTGSEMIVWGGSTGDTTRTNTGGRYDPVTNTWTATSLTGAPNVKERHTAIWLPPSSQMIVWGGTPAYGPDKDAGFRYAPASDTWIPISKVNAPSGRSSHFAFWTGEEMLIWGGYSHQYINTGGRWDPDTDSWVPVDCMYGVGTRKYHTALWTGAEAIIWGGQEGEGGMQAFFRSGGCYVPATDTWKKTSLAGAPEERAEHTAVWTGMEMIVWGGYHFWVQSSPHAIFYTLPSDGGRYDPVTDTWTPTSLVGVPDARKNHTAVWTGSQMIVWGGKNYSSGSWAALNSGGRYSPGTDGWSAVTSNAAPSARADHTAIWTGTEMIVWGCGEEDTGGHYDPLLDEWQPIGQAVAPENRCSHTAEWTGSEMIVWGGCRHDGLDLYYLATGGRYNPATRTWSPTSMTNAPTQRIRHTSVWTGCTMIVWGGYYVSGSYGYYLNSGGIYDPGADSWSATSLTGAPTAREYPTGIWTGPEMIVWGGDGSGISGFDTGGRYCSCSIGYPNSPVPADGATLCTVASLAWNACGTDSYDAVLDGSAVCTGSPTPSCNLPALTPGGHTWSVTAYNSCGARSSPTWAFTLRAAPETVQLLTPGDGASGFPPSVTLDWADAAEADHYDLYFGTTDPPTLFQSGLTTSYYDLTDMDPETAYFWRVEAVNPCGAASSVTYSFTTACFTLPGVLLSSPANGSLSLPLTVTMAWDDVPFADSYNLYFGTVPSPPLHQSGLVVSQATLTHLPPATYYWAVEAVNPCGVLGSAIWSFTVQCPGTLDSPSLFSVNGIACAEDPTIEDTTPTLQWTDVASDSGYTWEVWDGQACTGTRVAFGTTGAGVVSATVASPIPAAVYSWRVRALGDGNLWCDGPWTCSCPFTVVCPSLAEPALLTVDGQPCGAFIPALDDTPILDWTDVSGATGYDWQIWTGIHCSGTLAASGTVSGSSIAECPFPLTSGSYYWRVRAVIGGASPCSGPWTCGCPFTVGTPSCDTTFLMDPIITDDTSWDLAGSPYLIEGPLFVEAGATLTVEAGVILKFAAGSSATIEGALVLNGTATDRVVLTSLNDYAACGPSPGGTLYPAATDWVGIVYPTGASGSATHTIIRYSETALDIGTGLALTVADTLVEASYTGLRTGGAAAPVVTNFNTFGVYDGVYIAGNSTPSFTGGVWDGGGIAPCAGRVYYGGTDNPDPTFSGITLRNMDRPAVRLDFPWITGTTHWAGIPFWLEEIAVVDMGAHVSASDTTIYFEPGYGTGLDVYGTLDLGLAGQPVLLRSGADFPSMGDWVGVHFHPDSTGAVLNATIRHAETALDIGTGLALTVAASRVEGCVIGMKAAGSAVPRVEGTVFEQNETAVRVVDTAQPDLGGGAHGSPGNNTLIGTLMSLDNQTANPIAAQSNWWGCPTAQEMAEGMENITAIWDLHDDALRGEVDFSPWLDGPIPWRQDARPDWESPTHDVVLYWDAPPPGTLQVMRGTTPSQLTGIGGTSDLYYRDVGALDDPNPVLFYKLIGPCSE